MSGNCERGRGLRRREKNATEAGAGRYEKPAPDTRAAPPEAHESLIGRKTVEEVPLTGLSLTDEVHRSRSSRDQQRPLLMWSAHVPGDDGPRMLTWPDGTTIAQMKADLIAADCRLH
jgi:hypothetical protein